MKKILYVFGGPDIHPTEAAGKVLAEMLAADGRFSLEMTDDFDVFARLSNDTYAAVVVFTTRCVDALTPEREKGLLGFVRNGGGFVGVHSAIGSFRASRPYLEMLNGEFLSHPELTDVPVTITNHEHYMTKRVPDFTVPDEVFHLQNFDPAKCTVLAQTTWQGKAIPLAYAREYGLGRVAYLALGHDLRTWKHPKFLKLLLRGIAWSAGAELPARTIRCGVLGYGPAFNMGKGHAGWINAIPGLQTIAMCDTNPERVEAARQELPDLQGYFTSIDEMLAMPELDLVVNILPHNLHAPMTLKALDAGKHVVLEKPFCITVEEANSMIDTARARGLMLSLFHNRRWDGDYQTIRDLIDRGLIGEPFHIECQQGGYHAPGFWWRSDKTISGGVMYDWGAHFLDWILNMVPSRVTQVMGDFQKRVWHAVSNEDHGQVYIRFANGATAEYLTSSIAALSGPKWRIMGTQGAIELAHGSNEIQLVSYTSGVRLDSTVKVTLPGYGDTQYYRNVADHLLLGEELAVKPEQARRVIGVIDAGQRSSVQGESVAPAPGCE
ncbi:MAG TPA: ThuA domain-containing protein [Armatimonadota bacterium]|jgi:predicted dehydrogenase/type 1 glutamine amidotransferase